MDATDFTSLEVLTTRPSFELSVLVIWLKRGPKLEISSLPLKSS